MKQLLGDSYTHYCVGSLPFANSEDAIKFILDRPYLIPFWPELPNLADRELMLERSERALDPEWSSSAKNEVSGLYALSETLQETKSRPALIKGQVAGPLTHARYSKYLDRDLDESLNFALEACAKQCLWQAETINELGAKALIVLDEPGLAEWSKLDRELQVQLRELYSYLFVSIAENGNYLGLHSCASFDPSFLEFSVELLSFDATEFAIEQVFKAAAMEAWQAALQQGLVLAPGCFAAQVEHDFEQALREGEERHQKYANRVEAILQDEDHLHLLRSAACGHAQSSQDWLESLYPVLK